MVTALAAARLTAGPAAAQDGQLSSDLVIFSDMSNPAPRAVTEGMIERFGELHPDLNIVPTTIDREAYKTQIRNFLAANALDVANWYAGNRMAPFVEAGLFEVVSDIWNEEMSQDLASTKGSMTTDGKQWVCRTPTTRGACTTAPTSTTVTAFSSPRHGTR